MSSFSDDTPTGLLGEKLLQKGTGKDFSEKDTSELLSDCDVVGLYFSAHWCPPCRKFTPELSTRYQKLKEAGKKIEIVFVSSDRDEGSFKEYFADSMSFCALPYAERDRKEKLSNPFKVQGIPTLVFLDGKTGEVINSDGRSAISGDDYITDFPFRPKDVYDISESCDGINETASLVVVCDKASDTEKASITTWVDEFAKVMHAKPAPSRFCDKFFTAKGGGPLDQIIGLTGLEHTDAPFMIIFNLKDKGAFYTPEEGKTDVTRENIAHFINGFGDEKLPRQQVGK